MTHLGRWLSALVDGELDEAERDHVLNHLAGCEACRQEANALRALKRRMTALGDTSADSAVVRRLMELGRSDSLFSADALFAQPGWPGTPLGYPAAGRARPAWLGWKTATSSAGVVLVAVGLAAFLLGAPAGSPQRQVTPAVDVYWLEHVHDMGQAPTTPGAPGLTGPVGFTPAVAGRSRPPASRPPEARPSAVATPSVRRPHAKRPYAKRPAAVPHPPGQPVLRHTAP
jgi:hypothetical protein